MLTVFVFFVLEDLFYGDFLICYFILSCIHNSKRSLACKAVKLISVFTNKFTDIITININITTALNILLTQIIMKHLHNSKLITMYTFTIPSLWSMKSGISNITIGVDFLLRGLSWLFLLSKYLVRLSTKLFYSICLFWWD